MVVLKGTKKRLVSLKRLVNTGEKEGRWGWKIGQILWGKLGFVLNPKGRHKWIWRRKVPCSNFPEYNIITLAVMRRWEEGGENKNCSEEVS